MPLAYPEEALASPALGGRMAGSWATDLLNGGRSSWLAGAVIAEGANAPAYDRRACGKECLASRSKSNDTSDPTSGLSKPWVRFYRGESNANHEPERLAAINFQFRLFQVTG
jgi:hypothetical protein